MWRDRSTLLIVIRLLGRTDGVRGETGRAIEEYEAAVAVDPKWERARVNLIALYCGERQWTKAEKHFQTLVDLGLRVAEGHYDFGVCLAAQGETSRAAGEFRSALEINAQYAQSVARARAACGGRRRCPIDSTTSGSQ